MNSQDYARDLLNKLKEREVLDAQMKDLNKEIFTNEQELYDKMEQEGFDTDDGITLEGIEFKPNIEIDYGLAGEYKGKKWDEIGAWFEWLKQVGEDGLIKTKESVHPQTRKRFLKDWVEDENKLPDFVEEKYLTTIKYNKSAIKRLVENNERH